MRGGERASTQENPRSFMTEALLDNRHDSSVCLYIKHDYKTKSNFSRQVEPNLLTTQKWYLIDKELMT